MSVEIVFFLKPDAVIRRYVGARTLKTIINNIEEMELLCFEEIKADKVFLAEQHYVEHKGKFFYEWLVNYVASTPIIFTIIKTKQENVAEIRKLLGPTLPEKAALEAPASIRAMYGIMGGVNVAHASDAIETAMRESRIWKEYLVKHHNLNLDKSREGAWEKLLEYVDTYIDYPIIDSIRYRELLIQLKEGKMDRPAVEYKIADLLSKETTDSDIKHGYNKILSRVIIDNLMLKR